MDSGWTRTIGLAAVTGIMAVFVAQADAGPTREAAGTVVVDTSVASRAAIEPRWLTDANALALVSGMNARQIAAARAELQAWRSDTVRALAVSMLQRHSGIQAAVDSVARQIQLAPVTPALANQLGVQLQAQIDSMMSLRGGGLDRAYVDAQVASHTTMTNYLDQLAGLAERPEVQSVLTLAASESAAGLAQAQSVQAMFALSDSLAADSLAKHRESTARKSRRR
jgi:predicted outer membrane protein